MLLFNVKVLFSLVTNASILIIYNKKKLCKRNNPSGKFRDSVRPCYLMNKEIFLL